MSSSTESVTTTETSVTTSATTPDAPTNTATATGSDGSVPDPSDGEAFDEYIAGRVEAFYAVRDRAFAEPSATPEIDYPELADYGAEPQLSVMHDAIREMAEAGTADREPEAPAVGTTTDEEHRTSGVQTAEETVVTVFDCEVFDNDTYDVETDEVKIAGVITVLTVITLKEVDSVWKLTDSEVSQKIEGVSGCYLASDEQFPY